MKKRNLVFGFRPQNHLPKMNGRNSSSRFAAYKSDGSAPAEKSEEEQTKEFEESIKGFEEDEKAKLRVQRKQILDSFSKLKAEMITPEQHKENLTAIQEANKNVDSLNELIVKLGLRVKSLESGHGSPEQQKSLRQQVVKAIEDNQEAIKEAFKSGKNVEMEFKVVGTITTGSSLNPDGIPELTGVQNAPPSNANIRPDSVLDLVTTINTNQAAYAYTETLPKDGDFSFQTAEGAAKEQIDFKTETRYAQPVTLAAWEKLTQQSVEDIPGLQSIATDLLFKKHNRKKSKGILYGTGLNGEAKGATVYADIFTAGALANTVVKPNIMDVINAIITSVYTTHDYQDEMGYMPNICLLHPTDFFINFVAAKDDLGRPLYPQASLFNRVTIGGVTIVPSEDITQGKVFVADMSKYNVTNYIGYKIIIGRINDDLIKNQFVILGESRFHAFVKKLDEKAFVYDDIATVQAAIAAPAMV